MTGITARSQGRRFLTVGAALALAAALAPTSGSAAVARRAAPFDFDGDGHGDFAVGTPYHGVEQVTVMRGTGTGITTKGARLFDQDTRGVPGVPEDRDFWGRSVTSGDFDADGHADLVVGALGEDWLQDAPSQGAVTVLRGTGSGLTTTGARVIRASDVKVPDIWGGGLAVGDLDGDGYDDLVVTPGYPPNDYQDGDVISRRNHGVTVLYGSRTGLSTQRVKRLTSTAGRGAANDGDEFGYFVGVGDITGDGKDDLAVSDLFNGLLVWHGRSGLLADRADESVPGIATIGLALGDFDGDGHADLAGNAGFSTPAVAVMPGTAQGLDQSRRRELTTPVQGRRFGFGRVIAAGDLNGDGVDDLAAAGDRSDDGNGVAVYPGSAQGLDDTRARWWTQDSAGVPGTSERGDSFGYHLRIADQGRSSVADLVVSAPGKRVGTASSAGSVTVLYGWRGTGLRGQGAQSFTPSTPGVPGVATIEAEFGALDE